jgi:ribosome-binding factor A
MSHRIEKFEKLVKEEVSLIFLFKLKDPLFEFVTVTNVKVSPDLKTAKIYLSVFDREKRETVLQKITGQSKYIRSELASRIRVKFVPELKFFIDDTMDYVEKIEGLIKKIHEDDDKKGNN